MQAYLCKDYYKGSWRWAYTRAGYCEVLHLCAGDMSLQYAIAQLESMGYTVLVCGRDF